MENERIFWTEAELFKEEPALQSIIENAKLYRKRRVRDRIWQYEAAKRTASGLVGWGAKDPKLRCSGAWQCFLRCLMNALDA